MPLALALVLHFLERIPLLPRLVEPGRTTAGDPAVNLQVFGYVTALFVGGILVGLLFIGTVPRLLQRGLREDAAHPLYGIRYWLYRIVARTTNSGFCCALFGDSSAILHYLRWVGYRFGRPLVQSGSNFGVAVGHENPYLSGVGSATMVSDGLSFMNAEYSNTSFRLRRAEVGARAAGIWARSPCVRPVVVEACPPESNCSTVVTRECGPDRDTDGESDSDDRGGLRRSNTITLYTGLLDDASDNGALATIVHEMGHALGLVHRNDPDSVMNAETDDSTDPVPDAIDFANLVAIYG